MDPTNRRSTLRREKDRELADMAATAVEKSRQADQRASTAIMAISSHESLCAERYKGILDRLGKLEKAVYGAVCAIITIWAAGEFLTK